MATSLVIVRTDCCSYQRVNNFRAQRIPFYQVFRFFLYWIMITIEWSKTFLHFDQKELVWWINIDRFYIFSYSWGRKSTGDHGNHFGILLNTLDYTKNTKRYYFLHSITRKKQNSGNIIMLECASRNCSGQMFAATRYDTVRNFFFTKLSEIYKCNTILKYCHLRAIKNKVFLLVLQSE